MTITDKRSIYTWCSNCTRKCGCNDCLRMIIDKDTQEVGMPPYYKGS
jgi:hypothetical protein